MNAGASQGQRDAVGKVRLAWTKGRDEFATTSNAMAHTFSAVPADRFLQGCE
jgi:hypothetical protein